jgi:predicted CXXCH cytochrome family protein
LEPDHVDLACANCHGAADVFATPSPSCAGCHSEKGIRRFDHQALGLEKECGECHGDVASVAAGVSYRHPPLEQGCEACHDPRVSDQPFFLLEAESTLCFSCHESVRECYQLATVMHGPASEGHNCSTCHNPHGSPQPRLLSRARDKQCLGCHDRSIEASDGRSLTNVAARLSASLNRHIPAREDNCIRCHQPHAGVRGSLLREAYPASFYADYTEHTYDLCFDCHDEQLATAESPLIETGFRDGDTNLHKLHLNRRKGRTCRVCHDPHASDLPFLIRKSVQFNDGAWSFPMGYTQIPRGGRCAPACHAPMEYLRAGLITGNESGM